MFESLASVYAAKELSMQSSVDCKNTYCTYVYEMIIFRNLTILS